MAATILVAEDKTAICFTSACYNNFLGTFKIPLATLALSFPLAGMVAAYHRSIETSEQIKIAQTNNTFSNFIKHRDDFISHITYHLEKDECQCQIVEPQRIYRYTFPKNSYTLLELEISDGEKNSFLTDIESIYKKLEDISRSKYYSDEEFLMIFQEVKRLNGKLGLLPKKGKGIAIHFNEHIITGITYSVGSPLQSVLELSAIGNKIRSFNSLPLLTFPSWGADQKLMSSVRTFLNKYNLENLGK